MGIRIVQRRHVWLFALLLLVMPLTACSAKESTNPKKDIVGRWQSSDKTLDLNFAADGSVQFVNEPKRNGKSLAPKIQGTGSSSAFTDDTHIMGAWEMDYPILEVHIRGDRMTLKRADGPQINLSRVK